MKIPKVRRTRKRRVPSPEQRWRYKVSGDVKNKGSQEEASKRATKLTMDAAQPWVGRLALVARFDFEFTDDKSRYSEKIQTVSEALIAAFGLESKGHPWRRVGVQQVSTGALNYRRHEKGAVPPNREQKFLADKIQMLSDTHAYGLPGLQYMPLDQYPWHPSRDLIPKKRLDKLQRPFFKAEPRALLNVNHLLLGAEKFSPNTVSQPDCYVGVASLTDVDIPNLDRLPADPRVRAGAAWVLGAVDREVGVISWERIA